MLTPFKELCCINFSHIGHTLTIYKSYWFDYQSIYRVTASIYVRDMEHKHLHKRLNGQWCEKTCLRGFLLSEIQTSLLSSRDQLENCNFACIQLWYGTFHKANNKGADHTARMRRLVCALLFTYPQNQISYEEAQITYDKWEIVLFIQVQFHGTSLHNQQTNRLWFL